MTKSISKEYRGEIIKKAIARLSINVNLATGLTHPIDSASAKELFKALHEQSIPLEYQEIRDHAIQCGWPEKHANNLAELAKRIGNGGRVQIKHPRNWGKPTVNNILSDLGIG
uniref:Uncharacterized protein n=1 Tax=Candidatus Kentrum sp. FM TaxID=2126340 RepID=A0A450RV38_9GAMM|nr:MAG: protein of unknown function (DUF1889) [Candidatus Kentron sp. FM]VFJ43685.1 MAG: protein of unknown function (DUF1889) [Candidatus Kentron sp. FM]VFK05680.1 MAG: protein of unknown function (DUF1889) [Candidatus Kentron sp. FM]